jgi:uncharacterized protein
VDEKTRTELEAAAFRQLVNHLRERKDVQNLDLMNLAGFCRNCLSKWYKAAAEERGIDMDYEEAREIIYGMTYAEWKEKYQKYSRRGAFRGSADPTAGITRSTQLSAHTGWIVILLFAVVYARRCWWWAR